MGRPERPSDHRLRRGTRSPRGGLEFNHAMVYVNDIASSLRFYRDALGLDLLEELPEYARLRSPRGRTTIALHRLAGGQRLETRTEGVRLYFEIENLDEFCETLAREGVAFDQMPKDMPWGWRHAYLRDPDGREVSLYRAGEVRWRGP